MLRRHSAVDKRHCYFKCDFLATLNVKCYSFKNLILLIAIVIVPAYREFVKIKCYHHMCVTWFLHNGHLLRQYFSIIFMKTNR